MLVTTGKLSYIREDKQCEFKRNGGTIDVWYIRNGKKEWIGLNETMLRSFINSKGDVGTGIVTVDSVQNTNAGLEEIRAIMGFLQTEAQYGYGT